MLNREFEPAPYGFRVLPTAEAVSAARRHVITVVRHWHIEMAEEAIESLELLAGEVIANAVMHTEASCAVCVRWTGTRVRVEVTDSSPRIPRVGEAALDSESGRGLFLVDSLAVQWGTETDPAGKVVWFEIPSERTLVGKSLLGLCRSAGRRAAPRSPDAASVFVDPRGPPANPQRTQWTPVDADSQSEAVFSQPASRHHLH
ncbi:ATP-binding protein [Streptomyces sp. NPDC004237]|uniref:ATP-binding protein n=1 Tax=Streptomyces sp. NPDC004237 TaxID=3154455 RepID=UPI0033A63675